jgi:hypothetical protein
MFLTRTWRHDLLIWASKVVCKLRRRVEKCERRDYEDFEESERNWS